MNMDNPAFESDAIEYRRSHRGLIGFRSKVQVRDSTALSLVYTPGVAEPCLAIAREPERSFDVTLRGNAIAIVSDGSAAFGMGNIGPEAILPILESKAVIMKNFAGVDALPLALAVDGPEAFIETVLNLGPTFGAISIEDVAAPAGLTITSRLQEAMSIPVVNNHREGVAIGVLAGLINAARLVGRDLSQMRIIINGAGTAGLSTAFLLFRYGAEQVIVCDRQGALYRYRPLAMNWAKWTIAQVSNPDGERGTLFDVLKGADAYIGFAGGPTISPGNIHSMQREPILFTFGSPIEIEPQTARAAGAAVVATAHSTYPNQMDISSVVPGVFRGLLDVRAKKFSLQAQIAAAHAIASVITDDELHPDYIYPRVIDYRVAPVVAKAVASAIIERGEAKRVHLTPDLIAERTRRCVYEGKMPVPPKSDAR
jgi:malate dehydrogenase (oxaloacetate-decarboxylating)